jgi:hypothetical protein
MTEEWNVQASYKFGPGGQNLLNVRGADVPDLAAKCSDLAERLAQENFVAELGDALGGATMAQAGQTITNAYPQAAPVNPNMPTCQHGPMKDLSAKGYRHRWYCPAPKGTPREQQCPARD